MGRGVLGVELLVECVCLGLGESADVVGDGSVGGIEGGFVELRRLLGEADAGFAEQLGAAG